MDHYTTHLVRARGWSRRRPAAEVRHGTFQGKFVAITIRVRGSAWICHPAPSGDSWKKSPLFPARKGERVPRRVRKAAKMALRRWLNP